MTPEYVPVFPIPTGVPVAGVQLVSPGAWGPVVAETEPGVLEFEAPVLVDPLGEELALGVLPDDPVEVARFEPEGVDAPDPAELDPDGPAPPLGEEVEPAPLPGEVNPDVPFP